LGEQRCAPERAGENGGFSDEGFRIHDQPKRSAVGMRLLPVVTMAATWADGCNYRCRGEGLAGRKPGNGGVSQNGAHESREFQPEGIFLADRWRRWTQSRGFVPRWDE
jgi:hypothetical protein